MSHLTPLLKFMNSVFFHRGLKGSRNHVMINIISLKIRQFAQEFQICLLLGLYFNFLSFNFLLCKIGLPILYDYYESNTVNNEHTI